MSLNLLLTYAECASAKLTCIIVALAICHDCFGPEKASVVWAFIRGCELFILRGVCCFLESCALLISFGLRSFSMIRASERKIVRCDERRGV